MKKQDSARGWLTVYEKKFYAMLVACTSQSAAKVEMAKILRQHQNSGDAHAILQELKGRLEKGRLNLEE